MIRSRKPLPKDPNQLAAEIVRVSTQEPEEKRNPVSEYLAAIGRKGGLTGGKSRAMALSATKRRQIARSAARKRWAKRSQKKLTLPQLFRDYTFDKPTLK